MPPDPDALVPCGREEWESALQPVVRAINRDKRNFAEGYSSVSMFDPGPWRLVINFVKGGDPEARARVEALIQDGAPVEWREVKYSSAYLDGVMSGPLQAIVGPVFATEVNLVGIDVIADAILVETRGPQPI